MTEHKHKTEHVEHKEHKTAHVENPTLKEPVEPKAVAPVISLDAVVDAYSNSHDGKQLSSHAAGGMARSTAETKTALADVWGKLLEMGEGVNWPVVLENLWALIGKLHGGAKVSDVLAWLIGLFPRV